jgi:hypothetical protein
MHQLIQRGGGYSATPFFSLKIVKNSERKAVGEEAITIFSSVLDFK